MNVKAPDGGKSQVIAFTPEFAGKVPVAGAAKLGYKWRLVDFEKSPLAHVLSIKYDPYGASFIAWYIGGFGLVARLGLYFSILTDEFGPALNRPRAAVTTLSLPENQIETKPGSMTVLTG